MTTKTESLVERLREDIIADAFEERRIVDGRLAERLIRERLDAADEIERLGRERDDALKEHTDMMWQRRRADERAEAAEARIATPVRLETSELRERLKLKYMGDCKCGQCHLVPVDLIAKTADAIVTLSARLREAEEALEPFAKLSERVGRSSGVIYGINEVNITFADLRRAAAIRSRRDS